VAQYFCPHPSSLLIGKGYSSEITGLQVMVLHPPIFPKTNSPNSSLHFEIQAFDHTWLFILLRCETWRKRRKLFTHIVDSSHPSLLLAITNYSFQFWRLTIIMEQLFECPRRGLHTTKLSRLCQHEISLVQHGSYCALISYKLNCYNSLPHDDSNLQNCLTIQVTNMYVLTFLDFQFPACDNIFITFAGASSNGFSALSVSQYLLFIQYLNVRIQWAIIVYYVLLTSALYST
jgi:hypothetical protein